MPTITIPAGALAVSDAVTLNVPPLGDIAVSLYLPGSVTATTQHEVGLQTNYISMPGDFTGATTLREPRPNRSTSSQVLKFAPRKARERL